MTKATATTLSRFLLDQLAECGADSVFGVPGDYNLRFLDYVDDHPGLDWIGTCNELNAAYAADGYSRIKGIGVLVTTFGVGELSAMNGVAGAYAENVPLVHIVGMPATTAQHSGLAVHHSFGTGYFDAFTDMWRNITCATAQLTANNWLTEIERVLACALSESKPVCIALPADLVDLPVDGTIDLHFSRDTLGHEDSIPEICERIFDVLGEAKSPVAWVGSAAVQFDGIELVGQWLDLLGIPFAQTLMSKSLYDEASERYLGLYLGGRSAPAVARQFEQADCLLQIGVRITDFTSGGFSQREFEHSIEIGDKLVRVNEHVFLGVNSHKLLQRLTALCQVEGMDFHNLPVQTQPLPAWPEAGAAWRQAGFWDAVCASIQPRDIVAADAGTSFFAIWERKVAVPHRLLTQVLWASIGYSLPAALGAACAAPQGRTLVFIGDGAFQMTAQELSSIARRGLPVIVFLLNNDGYTTERVIRGPERIYNDIAMWRYRDFAESLSDRIETFDVSDYAALRQALDRAGKHPDKPVAFIELHFERDDIPDMLAAAVDGVKSQNS